MSDLWDRQAERAVIAAAMWTPASRRHLAELVDADDFYLPIHARIWRAIALLDDIGPFLTDDLDELVALWPMTLPASVRVRAAAVGVLADLNLTLAQVLVDDDDGRSSWHARRVHRYATQRRELAEAEARVAQLRGEPV